MKTRRYTALYIVMTLIVIMIGARLVNLQIANGNYYREKSDSRTTRSIELLASRGEILDRNGRPMVINRMGYNVYIFADRERTDEELNSLIIRLNKTINNAESTLEGVLPIELTSKGYRFTGEKEKISSWKKTNGFKDNVTAEKVIAEMKEKYSIAPTYSKKEVLFITATRLNMTRKGFSLSSPYLFMEDAPISEVSVIKEQGEDFSNVTVITQPVRSYPYSSLGAHMFGRVGIISAEEYEENKDSYSMNAHIGKSGIEKYLENYLRGTNGAGSTLQNSDGYNTGYDIDTEPVSGRNVRLTVDLDMQLACENALKETIGEINYAAKNADTGRDANAGSMVVIDVNSGDILAMASYPAYDIETFSEQYNLLLENPSKPLFNRALAGTYSPASTFKVLVGAAALEENIITTEEELLDTGKYTYFSDYQPACWIYNQTGGTHGYINVSEAIRDSCNVFFFDVGRRLGIDIINSYAKKFGFGQKSGIELGDEEKSGVVASPANRKEMGGIWYPGDVCQTAIGQSDTLVTPLQLANYTATVANGGTRYRPHLIKSIEAPDKTSSTETESEVLDTIQMDEATRIAITEGMRQVVTEGTAKTAFSGCGVSVAAKTGSAQTSSIYTDGICIAYAPYDKPQIAIACVVEKAGSGARAAGAVRKVVDSYFNSAEESNMYTNVLTR